MNPDIQKAFHEAVKKNDVETARRMIAAGADVNAPFLVSDATNSSDMQYSIFDCIEDSRLEMLELLISEGADVNVQNQYGESPLSESVVHGESKCVDLLIANDADVNSRDEEGSTPIFGAIIARQTNILRTLIENGADINVVSTMPRESAYSMARTKAWYYDEKELHQCVRILEEAGALENLILDVVNVPNLSKVNYDFLLAIQYQDIFGVEKALNNGADVNCTGMHKIPAISQAAYYANKKLCQLLVESGTKPEFIEEACHECYYLESDAEVFEYLIQQLDKDALERVCKDIYNRCEHRRLREIMDKQLAHHFHIADNRNP